MPANPDGGIPSKRRAPSAVSSMPIPHPRPSCATDAGAVCSPPANERNDAGACAPGITTMSKASSRLSITVTWRDGRP